MSRNRLRMVFMGTPDFAASVLRRVADWEGGEVCAVYCQPDRPAGRGHRLRPPSVKVLAGSLGLPVLQPPDFRDGEDRRVLAALRPDVLVVAAYGLILPQAVLDIPGLGAFNVHASLLPGYRGAAPVQRAIMAGDSVTGVTIMRMEAGLDTGPMLAQRALAIGRDDTAGSLTAELADLGGRLMVEFLEQLAEGHPPSPVPQDGALVTYAAKLTKADGLLDWSMPATGLHAHLRGVTPWPGGRTCFLAPGREPLPVLLSPGRPTASGPHGAPGSLRLSEGCLAVACADADYLVSEIAPAGRRPMSAVAFWNGYCRERTESLRFVSEGAAG